MKRFTIAAFVAAFAALEFAYAWARFRAELGPDSGPPDQTIIITSAEKHTVTPEMLATTGAMAEQDAPAFRAEATDGKTYAPRDLAKEGPLVLFFIKDGCPCSQAAEPLYNRLHEAYGSRVRFFGIIDGDVEVGRR